MVYRIFDSYMRPVHVYRNKSQTDTENKNQEHDGE